MRSLKRLKKFFFSQNAIELYETLLLTAFIVLGLWAAALLIITTPLGE